MVSSFYWVLKKNVLTFLLYITLFCYIRYWIFFYDGYQFYWHTENSKLNYLCKSRQQEPTGRWNDVVIKTLCMALIDKEKVQSPVNCARLHQVFALCPLPSVITDLFLSKCINLHTSFARSWSFPCKSQIII